MVLEQIKGEHIALWGAGDYLRRNIKYIEAALHTEYLIDNNPELKDKDILENGCICIVPQDIKDKHIDLIIITVSRDDLVNEISEEIKKINIPFILLRNILHECIYKWDQSQILIYEGSNNCDLMDDGKIKRYIECNMSEQICNLRCHYCYVAEARKYGSYNTPFTHSIKYMSKALSRKRLGGVCFISICSDGEPFLKPDIVLFVKELLEEGHYVNIATNATITKAIDEILEIPPNLLKHLLIKASLHYLELEKHNLLDTYFKNVQRLKEAGVAVIPFMMGCDEYVPYIDKIKELSIQFLNALPQIDIPRDHTKPSWEYPIDTDMSFDEYCKLWGEFDSSFMRMRLGFYKKIERMCYAGKYAAHLDLMTGDLSRCPDNVGIDNIYEDLMRPIRFDEEPHACPFGYCVTGPSYLTLGTVDEETIPTYYQTQSVVDQDGVNLWPKEFKEALDRKIFNNW